MHVRFLTRAQVAEELNISMAQAYALIRRGEIRAAKIGGRGDYRIGRDDLETSRGARRRVGLASGCCAPRLHPSWLTAAIPDVIDGGTRHSGMAAHLKCLRNLAVRQRVD